MRPRLLTSLAVLYAAFGLLFAGWTLVSMVAQDLVGALPLPAAGMLAAAAVNAAMALGIWRGSPATRPAGIVLHAAVTVVAVAAFVAHASAGTVDGARVVETAAKAAVHLTLTVFWLQSAAVRTWFRRAEN
ncbi:MAG: hypothetical protein JNL08_03990 [Planctomycetes bacterium]|nr:hypothetical protein [Planctomycetota bacterium]